MTNQGITPVKPQDENRPGGQSQFSGEKQSAVQKHPGNLAEKAKELACSAQQAAGQVATDVSHRVQDATTAVAEGLRSLAGTVRDTGGTQGLVGSASSAVADTLESGGRYLEDEGLSGIAKDLAGVVRRNPIPAILIGIGIGFCMGRATRT